MVIQENSNIGSSNSSNIGHANTANAGQLKPTGKREFMMSIGVSLRSFCKCVQEFHTLERLHVRVKEVCNLYIPV